MRIGNREAATQAGGWLAALVLTGLTGCGSGGASSPAAPSVQLVASCTASSTQASPNQAVQFTCSASGGNGTFTFAWDFGDGRTSTQQNPTHAFEAIGNFAVKVTVGSGGQTGSSSLTIRVAVNQSLLVGPDGGRATLTFATAGAVRIRVSLSATSDLSPYGGLEGPGYSDYFPTQATASGGTNTAELSLTAAGLFTLTVFEGNNLGGTVNVKVEVVS